MNRKTPQPVDPTGRLIGYARVSTRDQSVDMQLEALRRAGVPEDNLWWEVKSGVKAKRPRLELALTQAVRGDTFVVYKQATEAAGSQKLVYTLQHYGVSPIVLVYNCAHWIVVPIQAEYVVFTRSITADTRNSSSSVPPSSFTIVLRWKPVARI